VLREFFIASGSAHDIGEVATEIAGAKQKILNPAYQLNKFRRFRIVVHEILCDVLKKKLQERPPPASFLDNLKATFYTRNNP
jgi:hypothetical protein